MAVNTFNFTTGPATLPDVGKLSYNGCIFSPLYETKLSGKVVKDNANRTTKFMEYTIVADGYVTLRAGASNINATMRTLRDLLTAQGGELIYEGRGFDLAVNSGRNPFGANLGKLANLDAAWGPVPELIEFQPLGGGLSAKVQWKVTTRIPEVAGKGSGLLQLNYETGVSYGEDGFSSLSMKGTLEIPLTRSLGQASREVARTADDYRTIIATQILKGIDLSRFRVTRREFNVSRDKRTLEWSVEAEERPYMDPPVDCTIARGTYSVRPAKIGMGLATWLCTLKATYTLRAGAQRREAWLAFLALMRWRMRLGNLYGVIPDNLKEAEPAKKPGVGKKLLRGAQAGGVTLAATALLTTLAPWLAAAAAAIAIATTPDDQAVEGVANADRKVWLLDFTIEEGLYLDSKTVTFSATWRLVTMFVEILRASGVWAKVPEEDKKGNNLWAMSMKNISGSQSWLANKVDPTLDVIVDFGSDI